jgi:hypothetical protein
MIFILFLGRFAGRCITFFGTMKIFFINLNLFKSADRSPGAIRRQRLSTKLFLCLLIGI